MTMQEWARIDDETHELIETFKRDFGPAGPPDVNQKPWSIVQVSRAEAHKVDDSVTEKLERIEGYDERTGRYHFGYRTVPKTAEEVEEIKSGICGFVCDNPALFETLKDLINRVRVLEGKQAHQGDAEHMAEIRANFEAHHTAQQAAKKAAAKL